MVTKDPMRIGRFNTALTLLSDKLIMVIGGCISKDRSTEIVECFNTETNMWYPVSSLNKSRSSTTAVTIGNRYIYVFPGQPRDTWNTIEFLDVGAPMTPLKDFKTLKWVTLSIANNDMAQSFAFGSVTLSQNELLLFGGNKTNTFIFDFANTLASIKSSPPPSSSQRSASSTSPNSHVAKVSNIKGIELCTPAVFSFQNDYVARLFGNYLYAIDSYNQNLHVYSLKDKIWNYSSLKDLGVNL